MKLYTSYFYQLRNFPSNLVGLSTAVWEPKYVLMGQRDDNGVLCIPCPPLKPGVECEGLCKGDCYIKHPNTCLFLQKYYEQLSKINFDEFIEKLKTLANKIDNENNIDFAFMVYESPKKECSERMMIRRWFNDNGLAIPEWTTPT